MADSIDMSSWQGRVDPESDGIRWHQRVQPLDEQATEGTVLFGFASDAGVARNKGRTGARGGPQAIRRALANLAWHDSGEQTIYDGGDVIGGDDQEGHAMEAAQDELSHRLRLALDKGLHPISLGGGHAMALGSWLGLATHLARHTAPRIGIINVDQHFDLRDPQAMPSSGTPFSQIAQDCQKRGWDFNYACLGVSRANNTAALFRRATELGVLVHEDRDLQRQPERVMDDLRHFIEHCDRIYLTIDLDGLPSAEVPGVSAPAARGVPLAQLEPLIELVCDSRKLCLADIAELNPDYDIDGRSAKVAARIVHQLTHHS